MSNKVKGKEKCQGKEKLNQEGGGKREKKKVEGEQRSDGEGGRKYV